MKRILFFAIVILWSSCEPRQGKSVNEAPLNTTRMREVVVREVLQANSYTYVKALEGDKEIWMAIPKREVEVGKTYYYKPEMEMKDFKSKDLDRTFESIYFLGGIQDTPGAMTKSDGIVPDDEFHKKKDPAQKQELNIQREEGIVSVDNLYKNKSDYEHKTIKVKGIVTKFNPEIMNKNWVHIQDGTGGENSFDLTITTKDIVNTGDIVIFEGVVAIDRDFGHGYEYELILEEAIQINKKPDIKVN
jgi:hypothetical protein